MAERLPLKPHPSVYGAFLFLGTFMFALGAVLFWSFAARRWTPDAQRVYWALAVLVLAGMAVATIRLMRRAPKTQL